MWPAGEEAATFEERNNKTAIMEKITIKAKISLDDPTPFIQDIIRSVVREELTSLLKEMQASPKYLTRKEVCKLLNISLPTLGEYTRSGIITGRRVGSRILYDEAGVQAALKQIPVIKFKRFPQGTTPDVSK
jgi:excisionase family DNA binding protein